MDQLEPVKGTFAFAIPGSLAPDKVLFTNRDQTKNAGRDQWYRLPGSPDTSDFYPVLDTAQIVEGTYFDKKFTIVTIPVRQEAGKRSILLSFDGQFGRFRGAKVGVAINFVSTSPKMRLQYELYFRTLWISRLDKRRLRYQN